MTTTPMFAPALCHRGAPPLEAVGRLVRVKAPSWRWRRPRLWQWGAVGGDTQMGLVSGLGVGIATALLTTDSNRRSLL